MAPPRRRRRRRQRLHRSSAPRAHQLHLNGIDDTTRAHTRRSGGQPPSTTHKLPFTVCRAGRGSEFAEIDRRAQLHEEIRMPDVKHDWTAHPHHAHGRECVGCGGPSACGSPDTHPAPTSPAASRPGPAARPPSPQVEVRADLSNESDQAEQAASLAVVGHVTWPDGVPASGVTIEFFPSGFPYGGQSDGEQVVTAADGSYSLTDCPCPDLGGLFVLPRPRGLGARRQPVQHHARRCQRAVDRQREPGRPGRLVDARYAVRPGLYPAAEHPQ